MTRYHFMIKCEINSSVSQFLCGILLSCMYTCITINRLSSLMFFASFKAVGKRNFYYQLTGGAFEVNQQLCLRSQIVQLTEVIP